MEHQAAVQTNQPDVQRQASCCGKGASNPPESVRLFRELQGRIGNRALGRQIQAKLKVSEPHDASEQEADQVADQVMRMPVPSAAEPPEAKVSGELLQRKCTTCREEEEKETEPLLRQASCSATGPGQAPSVVNEVLQSSGEPLDAPTRAFFEPRFAHDFSAVRVHTDANAAQSARMVNALAYTVGTNVVFGSGKYAPQTDTGRRLLAHELTHTIQQESTAFARTRSLQREEGQPPAASGYTAEDAIAHLNLALSVAQNSLSNPELSEDRRARIDQQVSKLRPVLEQLLSARGSGNNNITFDFDPDPQANEINPGDASKSIGQLYSRLDASARDKGETREAVIGGLPLLQAKLLPGGLQITPVVTPTVQRCDPLVCVGIIILGGLLLAGCQSGSSPAPAGPTTYTGCSTTQNPAMEGARTTALSKSNASATAMTALKGATGTATQQAALTAHFTALTATQFDTAKNRYDTISTRLRNAALFACGSAPAQAYCGPPDNWCAGTPCPTTTVISYICPGAFVPHCAEPNLWSVLLHEAGRAAGCCPPDVMPTDAGYPPAAPACLTNVYCYSGFARAI